MQNKKLLMTSDEIVEAINLNKKFWMHVLNTNCYAYALGLDVPEQKICPHAYEPGVMSGNNKVLPHMYTYNTLLQNILADLNFLNISYKEVNPSYQTSDGEWKIAIFTSTIGYEFEDFLADDFHFLRQMPNGLWYHKQGWKKGIIKVDSLGYTIDDPKYCCIDSYHYEGCLKLKINKK